MTKDIPLPNSIRDEMERIYAEMSPAEIPWNMEDPPRELVDLVESGQVTPCKTIDIGCGAGNYAVYLASRGFDVTGVDISSSAIALARESAKNRDVKCNFLIADVLEGLEEFTDAFEFAHEWSVLHHIYPQSRRQHIETVHRVLVPGGKYFSVCFSDQDAAFGGTGKIRRTPIGTVLCFSSEEELRELFEPFFRVLKIGTAEVDGKMGPNLMSMVLMEKR